MAAVQQAAAVSASLPERAVGLRPARASCHVGIRCRSWGGGSARGVQSTEGGRSCRPPRAALQVGAAQGLESFSGLSAVSDAVEAVRKGKLVLVVDDEDRENEGDLIMAGAMATTEAMSFMLQHCSGLVCCSAAPAVLERLRFPLMVPPKSNSDAHRTAFTIPVDLLEGCSSGLSAEERARTIRAMASEHSRPHHFRRPGHVFPLSAKPWGVLQRAGHTEAAVDLAVLAGLPPVGVLCEVVNKDGTMARMPQLSKLAADHNLCLVSIADLIQYRLERESVLEKGVVATHSYNGGQFRSQSYTSMLDSTQHFALSLGAVEGADDVHVFVHRECVTGDVFGMTSCSCQDDLRGAINEIRRVGKGVLVYLRGGEACTHSSERNNTQEEAAAALVGGEQSSHTRAVAISGQIVLDLGIRSVCVQGGSVEAHSLEHYVRTCRHQFAS